MSLLTAIRKKVTSGSQTVFSILMLAFYIAGTSQIEGVHQFFHSHDHLISHTEAREQNPCHRAIYHYEEADKACGHHSHIVIANKCDLCDLIFHTDQILLSNLEIPSIDFLTVDLIFTSPDVIGTRQSTDSSRAPPVV